MVKEDYGVVLDYLSHGYPFDKRPMHRKTPIVQVLGKDHYVLLELVPKKNVAPQLQDEVYIGEGKREKIHHIVGKLPYEKLTSTAKAELKYAVKNLVEEREQEYVKFFNKARPLSTRMHSLELLPGLGKKRMWDIIKERKVEPFKSFDDIKDRVKLMPDPKKLIIKRIMEEIAGHEKHHLFVER